MGDSCGKTYVFELKPMNVAAIQIRMMMIITIIVINTSGDWQAPDDGRSQELSQI